MRLIALILALLVTVPACGPSQRQRTIHATYLATNTAHAGFVAFDRQHQTAIVARATTLDAGTVALTTYRAKRDRIVELFTGTYRALAAAALVEDDPKSIAALSQAASLLYAALNDITGGSL